MKHHKALAVRIAELTEDLGQHRAIASASLSRLFASLPQFRKWEIHTVFLHFRNFELEQKSCLRLLAELCGVALEELRSEKALLFQKFEYAEDAGAEEFRKDIATMEAGLKKLESQEQKYSAELDKALDEYAELKAQAADFDPVELYKARQAIRPAQEKAAEQQLEDTMHEKPSLIMLLSAKQETSYLLGADAEERQARQLIMHRNQEQYRISRSKRKRNDPER